MNTTIWNEYKRWWPMWKSEIGYIPPYKPFIRFYRQRLKQLKGRNGGLRYLYKAKSEIDISKTHIQIPE